MFEKKRLQDLVFDRDKMEDLIREHYMCIYKYCFYHVGRRKRKHLQLAAVPETFDDGGIDQKLLQMNIREALDSLEDLDKELIILRYYQELRIKDISRILHLPASTVRYKLRNAEKALKKRLEL